MTNAYLCCELTKSNVSDAEVSPPTNPLATEVLDNLNRYPHCILLTRVGQFYEVHLSLFKPNE